MARASILDPSANYTFSKYGELAFDITDILAEFQVTLSHRPLQLQSALTLDPALLQVELQENLALVDPSSEMARREALIFPVLRTVCKAMQVPLRIEYPVCVSDHLKGSFDYFIPAPHNLLVIEAKNADLARGFVQLAIELIALDLWTDSAAPLLYGAVTTGDTWKFGCFDRQQRSVQKDINTYGIPTDLTTVLSILFAMLRGTQEPQPSPSL